MTKLAVRRLCEMCMVPTDCPRGPAESLKAGRWRLLVLVGNSDSLAESMAAAIEDQNLYDLAARGAEFIVDRAGNGYSRIMLLAEYHL